MEKKRYVAPEVETVQMEAMSMMAQSMGSNLDDLQEFKGNASNYQNMEADANRNNVWDDLW